MMMAIIYQSHSIHLVYNMNVKGTGSEATGDKYNKKKARPLQANKMFSFSNMNSSIPSVPAVCLSNPVSLYSHNAWDPFIFSLCLYHAC